MKCLQNAQRRQVCLLVGLLVAISVTSAKADLPASAKAFLLLGDWANVVSVMEKSGPGESNAVCRLVAAHACLATIRNNEALVLFFAAEDGDLAAWKTWTESLHTRSPFNAVAASLLGDALARSGDLRRAEDYFTAALGWIPNQDWRWSRAVW